MTVETVLWFVLILSAVCVPALMYVQARHDRDDRIQHRLDGLGKAEEGEEWQEPRP